MGEAGVNNIAKIWWHAALMPLTLSLLFSTLYWCRFTRAHSPWFLEQPPPQRNKCLYAWKLANNSKNDDVIHNLQQHSSFMLLQESHWQHKEWTKALVARCSLWGGLDKIGMGWSFTELWDSGIWNVCVYLWLCLFMIFVGTCIDAAAGRTLKSSRMSKRR